MKRAAVVLLFLLLGLSGCNDKPVQTHSTCTASHQPLTVDEGEWTVCVADNRTFVVQNLQNASNNLTTFVSLALDQMQAANNTGRLDLWKQYELDRLDPGQVPKQFDAAFEAAQIGAFIVNGSWNEVRKQADAQLLGPEQLARQTTEAALDAAAGEITHGRQILALGLAGAMALGSVLGGTAAIPPLLQVRKKAAYWGAFSENQDVQRRQRLLGTIGLAAMIVGILLTALLVFLRVS